VLASVGALSTSPRVIIVIIVNHSGEPIDRVTALVGVLGLWPTGGESAFIK